jgi:hypothetical protein
MKRLGRLFRLGRSKQVQPAIGSETVSWWPLPAVGPEAEALRRLMRFERGQRIAEILSNPDREADEEYFQIALSIAQERVNAAAFASQDPAATEQERELAREQLEALVRLRDQIADHM